MKKMAKSHEKKKKKEKKKGWAVKGSITKEGFKRDFVARSRFVLVEFCQNPTMKFICSHGGGGNSPGLWVLLKKDVKKEIKFIYFPLKDENA